VVTFPTETRSIQCWSDITDLMYAAGVRAGIPPAFPASPTLAIREADHAARSVICPNHLLHYSSTINIKGGSSRLKKNAPFCSTSSPRSTPGRPPHRIKRPEASPIKWGRQHGLIGHKPYLKQIVITASA
jgi:hypothetical protein